jgi:predicted nucleotidyltransferase
VRAFLTSPNNILALEYEKAVARWNAQGGHAMHTHAIRRIGEGYHSEALSGSFVSATAIRSRLLGARDAGLKDNAVPDALREKMPDASFEALRATAEAGLLLDTDDFSEALYARLWEHREAGYEAFADCGGELSRRISTHLDAFTSFTQFAGLLKSREYTYTRICRALLHILLDIKQSDYALLWEKDAVPYLRVLGFRRDAAPLLSAIKKEASAPLVTKVADASRMLPPEALSLLRQDIRCADLYRGVAAIRTGQALPNEYTQGIVLV